MPLDLHESTHSPFCRSVQVLAKRIGVKLNSVPVDMEKEEHKKPDYLEMNPFHQVPVLVDDGFKLFESRAILTYLIGKYAPDSELYPKDLQKRALVDAMLLFDSGSLIPAYGVRIRSIINTGKDLDEKGIDNSKDALRGFDRFLSKRKFAAGDNLTVADISIVHSLTLLDCFPGEISEFSNVDKYNKKVQEELGSVFHEVNDEGTKLVKGYLDSKRIQ